MQPKNFLNMLRQGSVTEVLAAVLQMDAAARATCAPKALKLYKQVDRFFAGSGRATDPCVLDQDAVVAAVYGTASFEDIKALRRIPVPAFSSLSDICRAANPSWLQDALDQLLRPEDVVAVQSLWCDGVCDPPASDALIYGHFDCLQSNAIDETALLQSIVWRFFEVDGTGKYSLPAHDKHARQRREHGFHDRGAPWLDRLTAFAASGQLPRDRLLDSSLTAVAARKRPQDQKWFAQLHLSLSPSEAERTARSDAYAGLSAGSTTAQRTLAKRCLA